MNLLLTLFILVTLNFCPINALFYQNTFVTKFHGSPANSDDPIYSPMQIIKYIIKVPNNFPKNDGPVFYGVSGRESIEEMREKFRLFEQTSPHFNNAALVFVEHRYFGDSNLTIGPINDLNDLADLNLRGAINDNILMIKKLSVQLETRNFLLFGANHGGLLASYISNEFATDPNLNMFKVLAWASSSPLKYMRQGFLQNYTFDFQRISKQFANLLIDSDCDKSIIPHFASFFNKTRYLLDTDESSYNPVLKKLNIDPIPKAQSGDLYSSGLTEFAIFLKNSMKKLVFDNWKFHKNGTKIKREDTVLWKLCKAMENVPLNYKVPITTQHIEDVLLLTVNGYKKVGPKFLWRPSIRAGNKLNRRAALEAYQDCTNWQLMSCENNQTSDPFAFTGVILDEDCRNMDDFSYYFSDECYTTVYAGLNPNDHVLNANKYPRSFKRNVITTINKDSLFDTFKLYNKSIEIDPQKFLWISYLNGTNAREFGSVKKCDSDKMNDVRYLALRAFGCYAEIIDPLHKMCNGSIFNDGNYDDEPKGEDCSDDFKKNFPYGHAALEFKPQNIVTEEEPKLNVGQQNQKSVKHQDNVRNDCDKLQNGAKLLFILLNALFLHYPKK